MSQTRNKLPATDNWLSGNYDHHAPFVFGVEITESSRFSSPDESSGTMQPTSKENFKLIASGL